jgi:hypothetical protein
MIIFIILPIILVLLGIFMFHYLEGNKLVFDKNTKTLKFKKKEKVKDYFDIEWDGKVERYFPRLNKKYLDENYNLYIPDGLYSYKTSFGTEHEARRFIKEYIKRNNSVKKIIKY